MASALSKKNPINLFYIAPLLAFSLVYLVYPILMTLWTSLFEWNGLDPTMEFIGFANFQRFLTADPMLTTIISNFLVFTILTVGFQCLFGAVLAELLRHIKRFGHTFKTVIFAPAVLTPVIIGNVFYRIFDPNIGLLADCLRALGLENLIVPVLADPGLALLTCAFVNIWQWTGYSMLLYVAGMALISDEIYEAADVDGASALTVFFKITLPSLRGTHFFLVTVGVINSLKQFDLIYTLTRGGPANSTQSFSIYIFSNSMELYEQGYAAAVSTVMFFIALAITIVFVRSYDKGETA